MEEDIKYLDKMVKEYKQFGDLCNPEYEDTDRIYQTLENLIKGYRELEKENELYKLTIGQPPLYESEIISKSKIKEKIEELDSKSKYCAISDLTEYMYKKEVLLELLEG